MVFAHLVHAMMGKPLLHFLLLGGLLFLLQPRLGSVTGLDRAPLQIGQSDVTRLREEWTRRSGRPPAPAELRASVRQWLGDEALVREALRRGLDEHDPVVNQRLLRNLRFAFPQRRDSDAELLRVGRTLGMVRQDLVIRRRLIDRMEAALVADLRIGEAELRAYVAAHPERYARPARYSFEQVFIGGGQPDSAARAAALAARLRGGDAGAAGEGEAFALGSRGVALSRAAVERQFGAGIGAGFGAALEHAPAGNWIGPLGSIYGWHVLRITETFPAAAADFGQVREAAALALQAERRESGLQAERARLIHRYRIEYPAGLAIEVAS